jgi:hypothetical protein
MVPASPVALLVAPGPVMATVPAKALKSESVPIWSV